MAARLSCEDGIQECMESMPDLRANNAERRYLDGLNKKLRAFEGRLTKSELGTAVFVVTASLVLRLANSHNGACRFVSSRCRRA